MAQNDDKAGNVMGWSLGQTAPSKPLDELMDFPAPYTFKVMGPAGQAFIDALVADVAGAMGCDAADVDVKSRASAKGKWQSVSLTVTAQTADQVYAVYAAMKARDDVKYML